MRLQPSDFLRPHPEWAKLPLSCLPRRPRRPLREDSDVGSVVAGAEELGKWLASRPESFSDWQVDRAAIAAQQAQARLILSVVPDQISIVVWPNRDGDRFDGRKLWRTLHAIGLQWGDGDQFHWNDPTGQTDYLFSAEVDDGQLGYALPEEIAAGRQHFEIIRFGFTYAASCPCAPANDLYCASNGVGIGCPDGAVHRRSCRRKC